MNDVSGGTLPWWKRTLLSGSWWKDASTVFQNLAVGVGVLAGGLWAGWTFQQLQQTRRTQLEITRLESSDRLSGLEIDIEAQQGQQDGTMRPVFIDVRLANNGVLGVGLNLFKSQVGLALIRYDSTQALRAVKRYTSPFLTRITPAVWAMTAWTFLAPGQKERLSYLIYVNTPGVYLVDFSGGLDPSRQAITDSIMRAVGLPSELRQANIKYDPVPRWASSRFIEIQ